MSDCNVSACSINIPVPFAVEPPKNGTALALDKVKEIVVEVGKRPDKEFIPMVRYRGAVSIQRTRALLSFLLSMQTANICTTAKICKISQDSPDLIHLEGLHHPIVNGTIYSLCSRLNDNPKFMQSYVGLREFIGTIASTCTPAMQMMFYGKLTRISWTSTDTKWPWRKIVPKPFAVRQKDAPLFYPFAAPKSTEVQDCELLMAVHEIVPKGLPHQLRGDICQELIIQILAGDLSYANLCDNPARHVKALLKDHPGRYGLISLDSADEDGRSVAEMIGI